MAAARAARLERRHGKWIAATHRDLTGGMRSVLLLVSPDGKTVRPFGRDRWFFITRMDWLPDMSALAMSAQATQGKNQVWLVSYPDGAARRVTSDLNCVAPDGQSIVATQIDDRGGVLRVDVATGAVQAVTDDRLRTYPDIGFSVGNDGRMYFHANDRGTDEIWVMDPAGTTTPLTSLPGAEFFPAIAPAQDAVYYQYETTERLELHAMTPTGAARRVIARLPPMDGATVMSPYGRFVLVSAATTKVMVPLDGGPPKALDLPPGDPRVALSPDGTHIGGYFRLGPEEGRRFQLAIVPLNGGPPLRVFESPEGAAQIRNSVVWTEDGRHLAYIANAGGADNVWLQRVDGIGHPLGGRAAGPHVGAAPSGRQTGGQSPGRDRDRVGRSQISRRDARPPARPESGRPGPRRAREREAGRHANVLTLENRRIAELLGVQGLKTGGLRRPM